jgi:hypothetical protein
LLESEHLFSFGQDSGSDSSNLVAQRVKDPLSLVSSLSSGQEADLLYLKRFQIETIFGDIKSRGFRLEQTKVREPQRIEYFVHAVCFAFVWLTSLGVELLQFSLS